MDTNGFDNRRATDARQLDRFFGSDDVLALWIAEPTLPPPDSVIDALRSRSEVPWFGYEVRPAALKESFWAWTGRRHGWDGAGVQTSFSPSGGTSLAVAIELFTDPGQGVILPPPVCREFKPSIRRSRREPVTNPLLVSDGRYELDLDHLASVAADPANRFMILCNPHNPVGRTWTVDELAAVAEICADHDVVVFADEIHADMAVFDGRFVPFGSVAGASTRWLAAAGPIKTFGLAGVSDTFVLAADDELTQAYRSHADRFHLVRSHVFGLAAAIAAYTDGDEWLDRFRSQVERNFTVLDEGLPASIGLIHPEATYLAWIDLRSLEMDVPELTRWLVDDARLALSPGHWFGREGAGFARLTTAVPTPVIEDAVDRLVSAVAAR